MRPESIQTEEVCMYNSLDAMSKKSKILVNQFSDITKGDLKNLKLEEILELKEWKSYGAVSTPEEVVEFMIRILDIKKWENLNILEPGCGFYDFSRGIYKIYPNNKFTGVENNPKVYKITKLLFPQFNTIFQDFLLWETKERFDLVIGNPPYGIIGHKSHYPIQVKKETKKLYKEIFKTWFGKYNVYGLFIEKSINLLKNNGKLAFIIPATFMILDEFKKLRKFLAESGRIKIFYLGPKIFKGKTVSTCILIVQRGLKGIELYEVFELKEIRQYYKKENYEGEIIRFETPDTKKFEENTIPLGEVFFIHFAARSPEVKSHPSVSLTPKKGYVPVLKGQNLHPGWIDYKNCYSGFWMPLEKAPSLRKFYGIPHIVVGHTKGGKIVAAVDKKCYPWVEEIHLIPKFENVDMDKVVEYLNSWEVQQYMQQLYKDITPHTTITQLRLLPLPLHLIKKANLPRTTQVKQTSLYER
jgi:adenine-specific DNA-methyltransferase